MSKNVMITDDVFNIFGDDFDRFRFLPIYVGLRQEMEAKLC